MAKILVAGGFGAGKTTLVASVSEITPLITEEPLTTAGVGIDPSDRPGKTTTTVALDFGRITLPAATLLVYGTPGQERFWFMWEDLVRGALGAVVLLDPNHLDASFPAIDFLESRGVAFVVAVNCFHGRRRYGEAQIRAALELRDPDTTVVMVDARQPESARSALVALLEQLAGRAEGRRTNPP